MVKAYQEIDLHDVKICGAFKKFGSNTVLNGIDLDVKQGELLTLLGPSGCGKTTTLNVIAGFIEIDQGEVYIKGKKMNGVPTYKRDLGMVFQSYSLFPHMTIYENLNFGLSLHKVKGEESKRRINSVLELVKMTGLENRYPRELSGGQRQRVAIARALVVQPQLLLLDEPLSNLDAKLRHELRAEIKRLQKELGVTTIFVTHDQEEALSMSDRIVVMNKGSIDQIGSPTEIYQNPKTEFVFQFIGKSNCLHGRVFAIEDGKICVELKENWKLFVDLENILGANRTCQVGDEIKLYIRPEKLEVIRADQDMYQCNNRFAAKLTQMNYMGSYWELDISFFGESLQITTPTFDPKWSIGNEVIVGWKSSDMILVRK
ncbi:ABC transporter ATP-binding protein [Neobacillus sp. 114]|uniref:ABC transporter ATP-binding protein n=1 Tax=Neobacillus sp. 114 TaxID=3048535 RepID=UPI0024C3A71A|nr:ABC transporter ATP-binding protein [Neobacillus sp. 114]